MKVSVIGILLLTNWAHPHDTLQIQGYLPHQPIHSHLKVSNASYNYSRMFRFALLLLFAATSTSWILSNRILSNRKILQQIRTTHVHVPLISSGPTTDTSRCTPSYTACCGSNSDYSDVVGPLQDVQQKIRAVEYCLDNFGNMTLPDNADKAFIQLIRRYQKFKVEDDLVGMLKDLQGKETKLLPSNTATVVKGMNKW